MKATFLIFLVSGAVALGGCATNYGVASSSDVSRALVIRDSSFDAVATAIGPQSFSETSLGIFVDNETTQLVVSRKKPTGAMRYVVFVRVLYTSDWRFYESVQV